MKPIRIPDTFNYIGVFLTLACNFNCSYCINRFGGVGRVAGQLTGKEWATAINRLVSRDDLPVTLQGGEPGLHPDFFYILNKIKPELRIDLLTNLTFDLTAFMRTVRPERFARPAPYASIRVSYHPEVMELAPLVEKVLVLQRAGYSVGIWGILHPAWEAAMREAQAYAAARGVDFRFKEFLGTYRGWLHGTFKYPGACDCQATRQVRCRTTEVLVGPAGDVYRCHGDLYAGRPGLGNLGDSRFVVEDVPRPCSFFGHCNPCDVKVKTNRYQIFGHTAVDICFDAENQKMVG
ncbi:MAG: hypothetical protein A2521_09325 [Deltaproteobacteria bacterium RIFOXYD12_FULL_57_12]|nr:MAG: hypothetical protein A2521_09325 [Deltaproteobacteria bacterium RIFOXYD12_FULL_57_12]